MAPAASQMAHPVAALIGLVGAGKTTLFNKVCDAHRQAEITDDSCTRQFAKKTVFYGKEAMELYDGPGCNSKDDVYGHSYVLKEGLSFEPLNGIFVACPYDPRIKNNMGNSFYETAKMLKPEYFELIVLLVTKMDEFKPDDNFPNREAMELHIKKAFKDEYGIERVVFSQSDSRPDELFHAMVRAVKDKPQMQIHYTDAEFLEFFEMKAWKGREQFDLHRLKKQVETMCSEYEEGLQHLVGKKAQYTDDEFQDYVYTMIQQNRIDLDEGVYDKFVSRNGDNEVAFDDYAASIELQKIIHRAHADFRNEAKTHLAIDPDNQHDWRNSIRKCQHCGEIWVKVEGCNGSTQCGARPSPTKSVPVGVVYYKKVWERIDGVLRPGKLLIPHPQDAQPRAAAAPGQEKPIGCLRNIVWKDQAIVPKAELDCLFSTRELENILSSFTMDKTFQQLQQRKEREIHVFSNLNEQGEDHGQLWTGAGRNGRITVREESDEEMDGAPTTQAPVTEAPATTVGPTTRVPVTEAHATTAAPPTRVPVTEAPATTAARTTQAPAKEASNYIGNHAVSLAMSLLTFVVLVRLVPAQTMQGVLGGRLASASSWVYVFSSLFIGYGVTNIAPATLKMSADLASASIEAFEGDSDTSGSCCRWACLVAALAACVAAALLHWGSLGGLAPGSLVAQQTGEQIVSN